MLKNVKTTYSIASLIYNTNDVYKDTMCIMFLYNKEMNTIKDIPSDVWNTIRSFLPYEDRKPLRMMNKYTKKSIDRNMSKKRLQQETVDYYNNFYKSLNPKSIESLRKKKLWGYNSTDYEESTSIILGGTENFPTIYSILNVHFGSYIALRITNNIFRKRVTEEQLKLQQKAMIQVVYSYLFNLFSHDTSIIDIPFHIQLLNDNNFPVVVNTLSIRRIFSFTMNEFLDLVIDKFNIPPPLKNIDKEILFEQYLTLSDVEYLSNKNRLLAMREEIHASMLNDFYDNENVIRFEDNDSTLEAFEYGFSTAIIFHKKNVDESLKSIDRFLAYIPSLKEIQTIASFITNLNRNLLDHSIINVNFFGSGELNSELLESVSHLFYVPIEMDLTKTTIVNITEDLSLFLAAKAEQFKDYTLKHIVTL